MSRVSQDRGVLGRAPPPWVPTYRPRPGTDVRAGVHSAEAALFTLPSWCRGERMEQKCTTLGNLKTPSRLPRTHLRKKHNIYTHKPNGKSSQVTSSEVYIPSFKIEKQC